MTDEISNLAAAARARNEAYLAEKNKGAIAKAVEPYLRQIAERDAEIERLRKESEDRLGALVAEQEQNEALKREVAMFKDELAALRDELAASRQKAAAPDEQPGAPKQTTPRKVRRK